MLGLGLVAAPSCKPSKAPPTQTEPNECTPGLTMGTPLRLLTRAEYGATVRDLLGADTHLTVNFPREPLAHGLDNDATLNQVTGSHLAAYLDAAEFLAHDTLSLRRQRLFSCDASDADCGDRFIERFGLKAFRRPLTSEEKDQLSSLFSSVNATDGFDNAVETTLQALLQSPQFLYRDEQALAAVPIPAASLNGYELATRLSYFLWGTTPDDALLLAAANGELDTAEGLTAQAQRLLDAPQAIEGLMRFFSLWLYFDGVEITEKNMQVYPAYSPALAKAWRTSLQLFIEDVLTHEGTLPALLTSNVMYANDSMGMYGASASNSTFVRSEMPPRERTGLLTQPGFLAYKAMPDGSSPVRRGIFVLDKLLCQPPPPPPAGANITAPQPSMSRTTRERFAAHSQSDGCAGCHRLIDPVGFTFENYDGLGRWRDTENGSPIDASGGVLSSTDETVLGPVTGVAELSAKLASSPQVHRCLTKEFYRFALGRELTEADTCLVTQLGTQFFQSGGNFKQLLLAIVESPAFRQNLNPELTP